MISFHSPRVALLGAKWSTRPRTVVQVKVRN